MNSKNSATSDKKILKRSDNMLLYQTLAFTIQGKI